MNEKLSVIPEQETGISLSAISAAVMSGELTADKLALVERMVKMDAEQQFNRAFSEMQAEIPEFVADGEIPKRGKYLRFETMMHTLKPIYTRHNFSVSFSQDTNEKRVTVKCTLRHKAGHFCETSYTVRVGSGDSELQADCKASTTAKRYATALAFALVIHQQTLSEDTDASLEGSTITADKAKELEARCLAAGVDIYRFMIFAGSKTFAEIKTGKLGAIEELLLRKESLVKKPDLSTEKEDAKW